MAKDVEGENMYIYRCQDSLESIFTAIYRVYEDHRRREEVYLSLDDDPMLFSTEIEVSADDECCGKVIRTLRNRFGEDDYADLCLALASPGAEKAQAVYGTVAAGLKSRCSRGHLFDNLADADVNKAFKLARNANREYCHLRGFTRFEELEQGGMYARIGPKNNLLTFLMAHFADRFPEENFVLHDAGRDLFGVHPAERTGQDSWYLVKGDCPDSEKPKISAEDEKYQMLFKEFCETIGIRERRNLLLQRGMLPLRFREFMTEFQ